MEAKEKDVVVQQVNICHQFLRCARTCCFKKCCKKYKHGKRCKSCPKKK